MDTKGAKGSRSKEPSGPRIFERIGSRAERTVAMSAKTGRLLDQYVEWAAGSSGADAAPSARWVGRRQSLAPARARPPRWRPTSFVPLR
jgi:hypothetical protein